MKMLHQKLKKVETHLQKIDPTDGTKPNHKYCTTYQRQELGEKNG